LLEVVAAADLGRLTRMLWHFIQLILELVTLDIQLHHVLLDVGDLALFVLSLSKFGV